MDESWRVGSRSSLSVFSSSSSSSEELSLSDEVDSPDDEVWSGSSGGCDRNRG